MRNFKYAEFDSPDEKGSGKKMSKDLLKMLDQTRDLYGSPMTINSGYRTEEHNEKVGGKKHSSHLKGLAADIACDNSTDRYNLIDSLMKVGFNRIGIADTFIHVDIDLDKAPFVIWTY